MLAAFRRRPIGWKLLAGKRPQLCPISDSVGISVADLCGRTWDVCRQAAYRMYRWKRSAWLADDQRNIALGAVLVSGVAFICRDYARPQLGFLLR